MHYNRRRILQNIDISDADRIVSDQHDFIWVLLKTLKRFLKTLLWPFFAIVNILSFFAETLNKFGRWIRLVPDKVTNFVKEKIRDRKNKKSWRKLSKLLGNAAISGMPMYGHMALEGIVSILVICLQAISFVTTYGGAVYYLGGIASWAPITFALVVQATIVAFSFSLGRKERSSWIKRIVLTFATITSILFSYVGIVNNAFDPYENLDSIYSSFKTEAVQLKNELTEDNDVVMSPTEVADTICSEFTTAVDEYNLFITLRDSIESGILSEDAITAISKRSKTTSNFDENENNILSVEEEFLDKDLFNETFSSNETKKNVTYILQNVINKKDIFADNTTVNENGTLSVNNESDIFEKYTSAANNVIASKQQTSEFLQVYTKYKSFKDYQLDSISTYNQINTLTDSDLFNLENLSGRETEAIKYEEFINRLLAFNRLDESPELSAYSTNTTISTEPISEQPEENMSSDDNVNQPKVKNTLTRLFTDIKDWLKKYLNIRTNTMEKYQSIRTDYLDKADRVLSVFADIGMSNSAKAEKYEQKINSLANHKSELINAPDASIVAFSRLFNPNSIQRVLVPALFAILVDGGTILISWGGHRRRYSTLYAKSNRDYFEEEQDLFEEVFVSTINYKENDNINFEEILKKSVTVLEDFLSVFSPSPETVDLGCSLKAEADELSDSKYCGLVSLLINMGYLCPLSEKQWYVLAKNEYSDYNSDDYKYYCLKFNAESYLRQCLSNTAIYITYYFNSNKQQKEKVKEKEKEKGEVQ